MEAKEKSLRRTDLSSLNPKVLSDGLYSCFPKQTAFPGTASLRTGRLPSGLGGAGALSCCGRDRYQYSGDEGNE